MNNEVRFVIAKDGITLYMDGKSYTMAKDHEDYDEAKDILLNCSDQIMQDEELHDIVVDLFSRKEKIVRLLDSKNTPIVIQDGILEYKGNVLKESLVKRMLEVNSHSGDLTPFIKFLEKIFENPSGQSINELYAFLERNNLPITNEGDFLAYKKVGLEFLDLHTSTIDNSPGKEVWMSRMEVNPDRTQTCSHGLHVCSKEYLPHYGSDESSTVVVVQINPRDVVSVPEDYNDAKMRVCRYKVLEELPEYRYHKVSDYYADIDEDYIELEEGEQETGVCRVCGETLYEDDVDICSNCEDEEYWDIEEEMASYSIVEYTHSGSNYVGYKIDTVLSHDSVFEVIENLFKNNFEIKEVNEHLGIQNKIKSRDDIKYYNRALVLCTEVNGVTLDKPRFLVPSYDRVEVI